MNEFNLRVRKTILETILKEEEFRLENERNEAKEALFALMQGKAKVTKIEESEAETIENARDKNDFAQKGHTHIQESPIILFTFNHKDYSTHPSIDKEYYYTTESSDRDFPGYEEIKLVDISIQEPYIIIYDYSGNNYKFTSSELGRENFKHLEKSLRKYIK